MVVPFPSEPHASLGCFRECSEDGRRPGSIIGQEQRPVTTRQPKVHTRLGRAAVQIFAANERMNQMLIEHLDPAAWTAKPPAKPPGKVRTRSIAAIFTHMHNV